LNSSDCFNNIHTIKTWSESTNFESGAITGDLIDTTVRICWGCKTGLGPDWNTIGFAGRYIGAVGTICGAIDTICGPIGTICGVIGTGTKETLLWGNTDTVAPVWGSWACKSLNIQFFIISYLRLSCYQGCWLPSS
jgi:hypothetical protein